MIYLMYWIYLMNVIYVICLLWIIRKGSALHVVVKSCLQGQASDSSILMTASRLMAARDG